MTTTLKPPYAEEIKLIKQYVDKDSVCLDIGANIGSYTVFLSSICKNVYAFEPEPNNYKQLERNTQHLNNVDLFQYAVSTDEIDHAYLYLCDEDPGMHRLYESKWCKGGQKVMVFTTNLDFWIPFILEKITFIKIDVEGWEYQVIKGAVRLIEKYHPAIMMEFHPPTLIEANTDPRELYDFMINKLGYHHKPIHVLLDKEINSYEELFNYTSDIPAINILWIPKTPPGWMFK